MSASTFLCSISGSVPVDPVVSSTSGLLFERRLIESYLAQSGNVCPRTHTALTIGDLISVKTALSTSSSVASSNGVSAPSAAASSVGLVRPRPPSATSVPGLISLFQLEWDAMVLESFQVKQQLERLKQELARSLYKEDAAARVIARLVVERDEARRALGQTEKNVGAAMQQHAAQQQAAASAAAASAAAATSSAMDIDDNKSASSSSSDASLLPASVLAVIDSTAASLSRTRKQCIKDALPSVASIDSLRAASLAVSHTLHATTTPGITALDLSAANDNLVLTGGADGKAILFDRASGKIAATLSGHKAAVVAVKFNPASSASTTTPSDASSSSSSSQLLFTASADATAKVWRSSEGSGYSLAHTLSSSSSAPLVGLSVHPSGSFLASASRDGSFAFWDVESGRELNRIATADSDSVLSSIDFHPDGAILATTGSASAAGAGVVRIYDVRKLCLASSIDVGHGAAISSFAFAPNGYVCASGGADGRINVWDLRKAGTPLANVYTTDGRSTLGGADVSGVVGALAFDSSASFLLAGVGARTSVYSVGKSQQEVVAMYEHKDRVTGVAFGRNAKTIITVGMDRHLNVYA